MDKIEPKDCTGSLQKGHTQSEYDTVGLSPCGEYVCHSTDKSCKDVKDIKDDSQPGVIHICQCKESVCPCGSFISHKVSDPCPIKSI